MGNGTFDKNDRKQESDICANKLEVTTGSPKFRKEYGDGALIVDHAKSFTKLTEIEGEQEKNGLGNDKDSSVYLTTLLDQIIEKNKVDPEAINVAVIKSICDLHILGYAYNLNVSKRSRVTLGDTNKALKDTGNYCRRVNLDFLH